MSQTPAPCSARHCEKPSLTQTSSGLKLCAKCTLERLAYAQRNVPPWIRNPTAIKKALIVRLMEWDYLYAPPPGCKKDGAGYAH